MERENNGRGLFYGVIGVATLIVAIIGATFAWFTSTGGTSAATEIVKTGTFVINYTDGDKIYATNMKPATKTQVGTALANGCVDHTATEPDVTPDYQDMVCAKYSFTVTNSGTLAAKVTATINLDTNPFGANVLRYALFDSEGNFAAATEQTYDGSITGAPANKILYQGDTLTYTLVLWLDGPTAKVENDANKTLTGQITVTANQTNAP